MKKKLMLLLMMLTVGLYADAQPLTQDASFRKGTLKNGMTYYIRHNGKEPGLADFYIAQRVGSIQEESRQRGLAHFLEHMAFRLVPNFTPMVSHQGTIPSRLPLPGKFLVPLKAMCSRK